jgi:hypothetical protein
VAEAQHPTHKDDCRYCELEREYLAFVQHLVMADWMPKNVHQVPGSGEGAIPPTVVVRPRSR